MIITTDTARLPLLLTTLRLPTVAKLWPDIGATADTEGWPAARTLATLLEHEVAERANRRTARRLAEARLPVGKTLDTFDFAAVPMISRARITVLAQGDSWLDTGTNILAFGPPGGRQDASERSSGPRPGRGRAPRPFHPHHRSRSAAPDRPAGIAPGRRHRETNTGC